MLKSILVAVTVLGALSFAATPASALTAAQAKKQCQSTPGCSWISDGHGGGGVFTSGGGVVDCPKKGECTVMEHGGAA